MTYRFSKILLSILLMTSGLLLSSCFFDGTRPGDIVITGSRGGEITTGDWTAFRGSQRLSHSDFSRERVRAAFLLILPREFEVVGGGIGPDNGNKVWFTDGTAFIQYRIRPDMGYRHTKSQQIHYLMDGRKKIITIGEDPFDWTKGGLFIIRADRNWRLTLRQVGNDLRTSLVSKVALSEIRSELDQHGGLARVGN